jgi:hypothetical protein
VDFISEEQIRRNRDSRTGWELYTEHRRNVTGLLGQHIPAAKRPQARLCVLGAGNCNDLDLHRLRNRFHEIHLVDLDGEALLAGCEAQGVDNDPNIVRHSEVDVTGVMPLISKWRPESPPPDDQVQAALLRALQPQLLGFAAQSFDVVASTSLLTQLIEAIGLTLGTRHPQYLNLITNVRLRHLRLLLELTKPGGMSWLFSELVSSLTCPELLAVTEEELMPLMVKCVNQRNFFTGCNPSVIAQIYQRDAELMTAVQTMSTTRPWLWKFLYRVYAVYAVGAVKSQTINDGPVNVPKAPTGATE